MVWWADGPLLQEPRFRIDKALFCHGERRGWPPEIGRPLAVGCSGLQAHHFGQGRQTVRGGSRGIFWQARWNAFCAARAARLRPARVCISQTDFGQLAKVVSPSAARRTFRILPVKGRQFRRGPVRLLNAVEHLRFARCETDRHTLGGATRFFHGIRAPLKGVGVAMCQTPPRLSIAEPCPWPIRFTDR